MEHRIKWRNIYYMLTYAIDELSYTTLGRVNVEASKSLDDLYATLLSKSIQLLYENKFLGEYNRFSVETYKLRGIVDIRKSYNKGLIAKGNLECKYDILNINSVYNRLIKSAANYILKFGKDVSAENRMHIQNFIEDLHDVDNKSITEIDISEIQYHYLPIWYKPAVLVSELIIANNIALDKDGNKILHKLEEEDRLKYIFEKFVRNFYKKEYNNVLVDRPSYIIYGDVWNSYNIVDMTLENDDSILIIDTKFYTSKNSYLGRLASNRQEVLEYLISYRAHAYNNNIKRKRHCGLILYAKAWYMDDGCFNRYEHKVGDSDKLIIVQDSINLDMEFEDIQEKLISIADDYFIYKKYA